MLASSILHICVFLVSFGIIKHLLNAGTGKIKLYSPTSIKWIWFIFHGIWWLSCVITCSDFYPLSNQINLFMVINIWGIIILYIHALHRKLKTKSWDNVPMDLKYVCQQYFTCMCFLGFIRYNKTLIACGFRKYDNLFTLEYHIPLVCCPQGIWY
jgi:hypothetical protein